MQSPARGDLTENDLIGTKMSFDLGRLTQRLLSVLSLIHSSPEGAAGHFPRDRCLLQKSVAH